MFNFHLLDPKLDIPDVDQVMSSLEKEHVVDLNTADLTLSSKGGINDKQDMKLSSGIAHDSLSQGKSYELEMSNNGNSNHSTNPTRSSKNNKSCDPNSESLNSLGAETRANEIVMQMLGAVSSLGQAANEGGRAGLSNALKNQKDGFVSHLKKFQVR